MNVLVEMGPKCNLDTKSSPTIESQVGLRYKPAKFCLPTQMTTSPLLGGAVLAVLAAIQALGAQGPVFFVAVL